MCHSVREVRQVRKTLSQISNDIHGKRETCREASVLCTAGHFVDGLHDAVLVHSTREFPYHKPAITEARYRHIYVNSSHFIFAELSVVVQQDGLEAFERAGINVSAISKGFKRDLQCAKKHKTVQTKVQNQIYSAMEGMTLNVTDKFTICIIYAG